MPSKSTYKDKELIVFDLDGTLTETKSDMDAEMSRLITRLLQKKQVAIIGGGRYEQFQRQFTAKLKAPKSLLEKLFLFPTTSTVFYRYVNSWKKVYSEDFSGREKKKIFAAFKKAFKEIGYVHPKKTYGVIIEDRGTQVTFSALGQDVVKQLGTKKGVALKTAWRDEHTKTKLKLGKILHRLLPELEVHVAGYTSIDITRKGIDKAYGIRQIEKQLGVSQKHMLFVGDAIFPGGNDYGVVKTAAQYIKVSGPKETKKVIKALLK